MIAPRRIRSVAPFAGWSPLVVLVLALLLGLPAVAGAVGAGERREGQSGFDQRAAARAVAPSTAAARQLRASLGPQATVQLDPVTGTPREVAKLDGFLSGPSSDPPATIALRYVARHADLFRLDAADLAALGTPTDLVSLGGTHHLRWLQREDGVPVLGGELRAHVTADGRLLSVQGSPLPSTAVPTTTPALAPSAALGRVRRDAGLRGALPAVRASSGGATRATRFADGSRAGLVVFAGAGGNRLAWQVSAPADATHDYRYVLDATSGAVLERKNLVRYAAGEGEVWELAPTSAPGGGATLQPFPDSWLPDDPETLSGPNAHVFSDVNDDDVAQPDEEVAPSRASGVLTSWLFPFTSLFDGICGAACSWLPSLPDSWQDNRAQNATQVFWYVNRFHDHLAADPIDFTAADGNFETSDPVQAQNDDGAATNGDQTGPDANHVNNANMATLPDGQSPKMQMYLFRAGGSLIDGNGGDDASVVYHEYTHGLSNRLITDAQGYGALDDQQSGAMGEAWSDWYSLDYLVDEDEIADDATPGQVLLGSYLSNGVPGGLRTEAIDCPVGTPPSGGCPHGGYTFADYGHVVAGGPEVHADGEIWGQTLWDVRTALGSQTTEALVTEAMRLSPEEPSFLDERDAILQADQELFGGVHQTALWQAFAARGMGYYASTTDATDPAPLANFDPPPAGSADATLAGTVTDSVSGAPVAGATVYAGGHEDTAVQTDASGRYTLGDLAGGTSPPLLVTAPGYDRAVTASLPLTSGAGTHDVVLRRNWALSSGGAQVASFSGPDLTALGCGPTGAIDGALQTGWGSYQPAISAPPTSTLPASTAGPRTLTLRLSAPVDVRSVAIDPGATCGDDDSASLGAYQLETSADGATWSTATSGSFAAADDHHLNEVALPGVAPGVRFVRLTMLSPQGSTTNPALASSSFLDVSELSVYGAATATPAPPPAPPPPPSPGPPAVPLPTPPAPSPAPAPPAPTPRASHLDRSAPRLTLTPVVPSRHSLATLVRSAGLPLRLRCDERCTLSVRATIPRATARPLRISASGSTALLATVPTTTVRAGRTTTLALRVSRATARRLGRAHRISLTLTTAVRDGAGNRTTKTVRVTLTR